MFKYYITRFAMLIPKLMVISIIVFIGIQMIPGDPITRTIPPEVYAHLSPAQLDELRHQLGLDDSMVVQYLRWVSGLLRGDFGYSLVTGGKISGIIANRLPATFELAFVSLVFATILGLLFGFISAIKKNTIIDYTNTVFGMIGVSVPPFFFGLLAILLFSIHLRWFPTGGRMGYGHVTFFARLKYLVLPAFILGISLIATLMKFTRGSMLDVLSKEYIKVARSKGLSEIKVNLKHGFRNALIPIMVVLVMRIPMLVGGTVIIETVFNYPGMGSLMVSSISGSDMPVVMIGTLIMTSSVLLASFFVDVFAAVIDPRIRFGADTGGDNGK